ncbi:hypothetical protein GE115_08610 [Agromyces sp. CFH 90414]|uniref:Type VII secretion integral membrane protein EccD n=1 Tax=Agromyces agglutinans TaxID=2662258 RepID=A0A6I2FB21_9MICO|nr:hypothetical protein [Agromyces agglutinans]MRG59930.1 hypothetical protein [Agromyces agglutinans]
MTLAPVERRRITLLGDAGSVDLAVPADDRLDDALRRSGLALDPRVQFVVDRNGYQVDPATPGGQLDDGGLYAVVTVTGASRGKRRARAAPAGERRVDHGARWMLLGLAALLAGVLVSLVAEEPAVRMAVAGVLGVAAIAVAIASALRSDRPGAPPPIAMAAPVALAAVAMGAMVPGDLTAAGQLRIAVGLLAAAVLASVLAVCTADASVRAAWGTVALLVLSLAAVWGAALLLRLPIAAAAAVTLGLVPVALRALPSTLVNVPDGMFIDYRHFMSNRWSVRGAIPDSPAAIATADAERVVRASTARLTAGTLVLALATVGAAPLAAPGIASAAPLTAIGTIALFACVVLSMLLTPRHTIGRAARWLPRGAAIAVLLVGVAAVADAVGPTGGLLAAASVFAIALITAIVSLPLARGGSSLVWSRVGDVIEWLAVALALPAALLAANSIELLRGMIAG